MTESTGGDAMKTLSASLAAALALATAAPAGETIQLRKGEMSATVRTEDGPVEITRRMTDCALNEGFLQPMVPVEGVRPVGEVEVLEALETGDALVVDMRTIEWRVKSTIPGSVHIPYTEVAERLDELGCTRTAEDWDCAEARAFIGFCNGPVCPQSPVAMRAAHRAGFPAEKMAYYRGGMMAWQALGLTAAEGMF
jgi:rhodanese-related sulfurtransferase